MYAGWLVSAGFPVEFLRVENIESEAVLIMINNFSNTCLPYDNVYHVLA